MSLAPGTRVGQYEIKNMIGEGGMGAVYRAEQASVNRTVAIKVLTTGLAGDNQMLNRFRREVDMIASLEHPHILPVYDFGEHDGEPYIVMRYVSGGTLFDKMQTRIGRERGLEILAQVAEALDYAHQRGIVHRDLKPANVLLDEHGNAYLGDFGLAKTVAGTRDLTETGSILGTPAYMSPEQSRGERLDQRSDVYSFAALTYEVLSGERPFEAETPLKYLDKHLTAQPRSILDIDRTLGAEVDGVFQWALAKNPAERPESATGFLRELRASLSAAVDRTEQATILEVDRPAARAPAPEKEKEEPREGGSSIGWLVPAVLAGAGVLIVALLLGVGAFLGFRGRLFGPTVFEYPVGNSPRAALHHEGSVWVANFFDESLQQLSAACEEQEAPCGESLGTVVLDDLPVGVGAYEGSLWVAGALNQNLLRVDPSSGEVIDRFELSSVPSGLEVAGGFLWAVNNQANSVTQIGPNGEVLNEHAVGDGPLGTAYDGQTLWVGLQAGEELVQLDPEQGEVAARIPLQGGPSDVAYDGELLWVSLADSGQVVAIDPEQGSTVHEVDLGGRPVALLTGGGSLFVADQAQNVVQEIGLMDGGARREIQVGEGPFALAWSPCSSGCGDLWVVNEGGDSVSRVRVSW